MSPELTEKRIVSELESIERFPLNYEAAFFMFLGIVDGDKQRFTSLREEGCIRLHFIDGGSVETSDGDSLLGLYFDENNRPRVLGITKGFLEALKDGDDVAFGLLDKTLEELSDFYGIKALE